MKKHGSEVAQENADRESDDNNSIYDAFDEGSNACLGGMENRRITDTEGLIL